jgi:hypothetical protein
MNAKTTLPNRTQLHIAAERYHNPYADYTADFQDLFSHAMDRALGIQKASLAAVVKMQSDMIEMQKQAYNSQPALGNLFDTASQAFATCLEIQLTWLKMMVACAKQGAEMCFQLAAVGTTLASNSASQAQPESAEEEEPESISHGLGAA